MNHRHMYAAFAVVGFAGLTACGGAKVVAAVPPPPPVVVAEVPPPPPPAPLPPRLQTVCDATIELDGHLHFPHEVEFEIGKSALKSTDTNNKILQCLVDFMANNTIVTKFRLEGYTDNQGDPEQNRILSEARANAVVTWMTAHGADGTKLWAKGYGPKKPVAPNDTPDNMAKNRRVEFHIDELDHVHVHPDRVAAAMQPQAAPVAAAPATGVAVVGVTAPTVGVALPTVAVPAVAVAVPSVAVGAPKVAVPGVAVGAVVAAPSVGVGIGVGGGGAAGAKGGAAPAPAAKDDKDKKK
jgi:outer membrane protein OmpA-like peptidoglycan-associated protein